ncbi:MAG TPA: diguanylate cyclase [Rhodocyclaceae bacterium]|nr:diguanylate cyclase [Rhodocyclaceae bacterium]
MDAQQRVAFDYPSIVANLLTVGMVAVDRRFAIVVWNRFMELNSNIRSEEVLGKNLFEVFPELNRNWLEKKIKSCLVLKTPSFSSWRQRPYLFRFKASPVLAGEAEFMYQDVSIFPIHDESCTVQGACVVIHDMTELANAVRLLDQTQDRALDLEELNQRDSLTGIYNRKFFDEQITQGVLSSRRHNWPLSMAMIDIDHFKLINDTYGHPGGDMVLRHLAARLQSMLRASDTFCRYGGEEFALILPHVAQHDARSLLDRLRLAIENLVIDLPDGGQVSVTVSVGVAQLQEGQTSGHLVSCADEALYESKHAGRNRVSCYPIAK